MSNITKQRGRVKSLDFMTRYPDGTSKRLTIDNEADDISAIVFDEDLAERLAKAGLVGDQQIVEGWRSSSDWRQTFTFLMIQQDADGGLRACGKCECDHCAEGPILG